MGFIFRSLTEGLNGMQRVRIIKRLSRETKRRPGWTRRILYVYHILHLRSYSGDQRRYTVKKVMWRVSFEKLSRLTAFFSLHPSLSSSYFSSRHLRLFRRSRPELSYSLSIFFGVAKKEKLYNAAVGNVARIIRRKLSLCKLISFSMRSPTYVVTFPLSRRL